MEGYVVQATAGATEEKTAHLRRQRRRRGLGRHAHPRLPDRQLGRVARDLLAVNLTQGLHVLRLVSVQEHYRVEKLRIIPDAPPPSAAELSSFDTSETQIGNPTTTEQLTWNVQCASTSRVTFAGFGRTSYSGSNAIRLTTSGSDFGVQGAGSGFERCELVLGKNSGQTGATEGVDQWWAHSIYLPSDFQWPNASGEKNLILQFHGYPSSGQPNFTLEVAYEDGSVVLRARAHGGADMDNDVSAQYWHGDQKGEVLDANPQPNVWYDFVHHIKWSSDGNGYHRIWMRKNDGNVVRVLNKPDAATPNLSTLYVAEVPSGADASYLKLGQYHNNSGQPSAVVHDRLVRGTSFEEIAMPDFLCPTGTGTCN
jgi:hypothetical protein